MVNATFSGTVPEFTQSLGLGLGCFYYSSGKIYPYYGSLNDFRIYDHCLSPFEIKEIAQGLILHYKLDDPREEETTNLLTAAQSCESPTTISIGTYVGSLNPATATCGNQKITYSAYIQNTSNVRVNVRCSPLRVDSGYGTFQGNYIEPGAEG